MSEAVRQPHGGGRRRPVSWAGREIDEGGKSCRSASPSWSLWQCSPAPCSSRRPRPSSPAGETRERLKAVTLDRLHSTLRRRVAPLVLAAATLAVTAAPYIRWR